MRPIDVQPATRAQGLLARLCLASSMAMVGAYVALSKPLLIVFPVLLLAWLRFAIAAIAMAPWLRRPADEAPMDRRTQGLLFLQSFLGNFLFSICMLYGMTQASAVTAGVIMAAIPAVVAVMSWLFLRERVDRQTWMGIVLGVAGIALLAWRPDAAAVLDQPGPPSSTPWGMLLLLAAVGCEAAYAVIAKALSAHLSPQRVSALINLWGLILMTPFGLWWALRFDFATPQAGHWALLVFYALAASVGTVWLWMKGIRHVPAAQSGVFMVMLPLSAATVGVLALGEPMGLAQWLAFVLALAGVALATWPRNPTTMARSGSA